MGLLRRPRPHSLAFTSVPFLTNTFSSSHQQLTRKSPICVSNSSFPTNLIVASGNAEEELFIRRHAAAQNHKRKPSSSSNSKSSQPQFDYFSDSSESNEKTKPIAPSKISQDSDEQFDFIPTSDKDTLQESTSNKSSIPKVGIVDETQSIDIKKDSKQVTESPITNKDEKKIKIEHVKRSHGALRSLAARARMETIRLIVDTGSGALSVPTGGETVLLAWELAFVLALLTLLRAGVSSTLRWIHNRLHVTRGVSKNNIPYEASVFECMQRPLEFLSLFTIGTALAEAVSRPLAATGLLRHIRTLRELGIIFAATWFLLKWIDRIQSRFAIEKRFDKAQVDATSRIATVATFIVSLLIALDTIGINVQTVLAFGGIGGVAIGFAGREIISNFFGGFMIYVTRPFSVGEWIRSIEEKELNGTVENIGWYLTRVRTWDKRPLYIPNSRFSTLIVENGSRMDNRRVLHTLHVRHEDMPVVPNIVKDIEKLLMNHQDLDPRQHRLVYVDSFDTFSVQLWMSCYTKSVFLYDYRRVQQDILIKCHSIIRAQGAKLATTNTRDVRPGANTDRYGPFGSYANTGQDVNRITVPETAPNTAPVNSDVPGAPRYGRPNPLGSLETIESGIDPAIFAENPNSISTGATVGSVESDTSVAAPNGVSSPKSTSEAAVVAAAAALAAARRNARRMEGIDAPPVEDSLITSENINDSTVPNVDTKVSTTPASGQMKISAAPPIRQTSPSGTGPGVATSGSGGNTNDTPVESGLSNVDTKINNASPSGQMKISAAPPIRQTSSPAGGAATGMSNEGTSESNKVGIDSKFTSTQSSGQMKISAAPPIRQPSPTTSSGNTNASGSATANNSTISGGNDQNTNSSDTGSSLGPHSIASVNDDSGQASGGVMKISKAKKPLSLDGDTISTRGKTTTQRKENTKVDNKSNENGSTRDGKQASNVTSGGEDVNQSKSNSGVKSGSASTHGVMKTSKGRKPVDMKTTGERNPSTESGKHPSAGAAGNGSSSLGSGQGTSEQNGSMSDEGKEESGPKKSN